MSTSTTPSAPSAIDYDESLKAKLEQLKRQRTYRRGKITTLSNRLALLMERPAHSVAPTTVESLGKDIRADITKHNDLQEQLDLLSTDPATSTEEADREKHDEIHLKLTADLEALTLSCSIHHAARLLKTEIKGLLALGSSISSSKEEFKQVSSAKADLHVNVLNLPDNPEAQRVFDEINNLYEELRRLMASVTTTTIPTTSPTIASSSDSHERQPRMAPLNLEIPKFNGDPLQWEAFELSLVSLLKHRAEGFSDTDKFAIIRQSIVPAQGKALIADKLKSGSSVDELLKDLRQTYGRPQLVIPILVQKVTEPPRTDQSATSLRRFKETVLDPYRALDTHLNGNLGLFLPHFLRPYLEGKLREDWERLLFEKLPKPTMKDLSEFIQQRLLWADTHSRPGHYTNHTSSSSSSNVTSHPPSSPKRKSSTPAKCASCGEAHWLGRCPAFTALGIEDRNRLVREKRLCLNCLSPAHAVRQCNNKHSCRHCKLRHHSLLHREQRPGTGTAPSPPAAPPTVAVVDHQVKTKPASVARESGNFICTVVARLQHEGNFVKARVLLDHGSGGSFMTEEMATQLKLPRHAQDRVFEGFGQGSIRSKFKVYAPLLSTTSTFKSTPIVFSIIPHAFTTSPPVDRDAVLSLASEQGLALSDPLMGGQVDIILGEEHPWDVCGQVTRINRHRFIATEFGYGVVGPLASHTHVITVIPQDSSLHDDLSRLWSLDQVPEASTLTKEEQRAVDIFNSSTSLKNGRVTVSLPIKEDPPPLGDSRRQALSRFYHNERSLKARGKLKDFNNALQEYLDLGHAHVIPFNELSPTHDTYYMPVHGVFKDSSSTTKVRPVFDASAKTTSGASLNDCLLIGPNLYPQLSDVLIQFRQHKIGLSADISKMFREILLHPDHQDLHRFILRQSNGQIVDCRMERVTFGVASSPYLATQTLRFLAQHFKTSHPRAAAAIENVFYVDDFVAGADSVEEADSLRTELCGLLSKAGMILRKWRSNSKEFLSHTPAHLREQESATLHLSQSPKALGAHWDVDNDVIHISVPPLQDSTKITKRHVASISAAVFDVMGLFAPSTIIPRSILQLTWKRKIPWDKELPDDLRELWLTWVKDLPLIQQHPIPRRFFTTPDTPIFISLHGFSDASTTAYGAAVYFRVVLADGSIHTTLVSAKARVLPTKHTTIPKAELLGAHLLSKLLLHLSKLLNVSMDNIYAWTDSAIVLHWLTKHPSQLRDRFVANRIQHCQDLLPTTKWRHVPSEQNPADLASRGVAASDLVHSSLWWAGPQWLSGPPDSWPVFPIIKPPEAITVLTISPAHDMEPTQSQFLNKLWERFSSFHTLTRVFSWIQRFYNRIKFKVKVKSPHLTSQELLRSRNKLFKLSQHQDFPEVFTAIKEDKVLPQHHPLHKLLPILKDDLLYLKSRVRNSSSPTSPRLLIPLHHKSKFTRLWIKTLHRTHLHAGVSALQSIITTDYYIAGLRNLLKQVSRSCMHCQRAYARPLSHQLGLLPSVRTTPSPPFQKTGVDFAGPLYIRRGYTRKPVIEKCYVAVFVCMVTKAIHLDLCASLSTEDFRATLSRFVARRGCPSDIYSDNGSNFVGAREEIRELGALLGSQDTQAMISHFSQQQGLTWHNIPPRAPHFGGLWEAAVRTMKVLLRKNLQPHHLRYDELYTILLDAESILNSRPITTIREEEASLGNFITAGHFIIGRPLRAPPTPAPPTSKISTLRRWRLVSRLKHDLWQSWIKLYLQTQHERNRWTKPKIPLQVGDLVFVKDEVLRTRQWPLARITETFPGDDGQVRAVKLLCQGKTFTRATQMLIPFHPDQEDNSLTSTD